MRPKNDFDGDSFDDIFTAHVFELGRNTKQAVATAVNIDIHDDMLQSLHRWPQHVGEAGPKNSWSPDYKGASN